VTDAPDSLPAFGRSGRCLKCGRPIDPSETMCAICNRAGMTSPAATQMHGTLAVAIVGSVVALGVVASVLLSGVGPFSASVLGIAPVAEAAAVVTVEVTNDGSRAGRARCEVTALDDGGTPVARTVALSPEVPPGETIPFEAQVPGLTEDPARAVVLCQ
jgi:uncharacterized OB-fold protein